MSNAWLDAQEREREWPLRYIAGKDLPKSNKYPHHRIVVTAGLLKLPANALPYWSLTCEIVNKRKRRPNDVEEGGAAHDLILEHFPELAPIAALHLSDGTGVPMHAYRNAVYWIGLTQFKTHDMGGDVVKLPHVPTLMSHLRITEDEALALIEEHRYDSAKLEEDIFQRWSGRWAQQSEEAAQLLQRLVTER